MNIISSPIAIGALVALSFGLIVMGGWLKAKAPGYSARWIRCNQCLDLYQVPTWEAEGFICPNCRNGV